MISQNMLTQKGRIYRFVEDNTKSFVQHNEAFIAEYDCYVARKSDTQVQTDAANNIITDMEVYMNLPADIKSGDRFECDGESFTVGYVYKPLNRHIQADLKRKVEA